MQPTRYASFFKRFIAHLVDVILANLMLLVLAVPVVLIFISGGILSSIFSFRPWDICSEADIERMLELIIKTIPLGFVVMWILIFIFFYWLYFAVFESSSRQATPGKMMMGIFVTDIHGRRISFPRALGRTLGKVLSKAFCYLGYLLALFTDRSQALHDLLANTLVLEPDHSPAPPMVSQPPAGYPAPDSPTGSGLPQQKPGSDKPEQV